MFVEPSATNPAVTGAIRQAARMTGADFRYLLATAQVESNLNPNAQASTSSARGLFQFTDQTWLATLKEQGPALGYGPYANAIVRQPSGDYAVADPRMSDTVLNLRADPAANSLMAGAFTKLNSGKLAARLGRNPTEGELYIAHFLGATGASRLIGLADSRPSVSAASVFPSAARTNPSIFYDARGNARGAGDVYRTLVGRYDVARGGPTNSRAMAANSGEKAASKSAFSPDTALMTETFAQAGRMTSPPAKTDDTGPVFYGLFRTSAGREAVAPLVSALWSAPSPVSTQEPATAAPDRATPERARNEDLGLFQDSTPDARTLFRGPV